MSQPYSEPTDAAENEPPPDRSLVDGLLPAAWPADLAERLGTWQTGHLLPRPALTWAGVAGDDPVTGVPTGDGDAYDWEPLADPDLRAPYGLVVSQTCDIVAAGTGRKHPFVDVPPVFRRNDLDKGPAQDIEQFKVTYLVALTAPPDDGFWVADLRLVMPVSKALLASHTPVPGFANAEDLLNLAEAVARKRRRPALHDVLSEDLPSP